MPDDQQQPQDAARPILDPLPVDSGVKRAAWDAFHNAGSPEEFRKHFDTSPIPVEAKRALWNAKYGGQQETPAPASRPGAIQTRKGGTIYQNAIQAAKAQQEDEKGGAAAAESAVSKVVPGGELAVGATKGLLSTGRNLGGLGIRAIRAIAPETGEKLANFWPEALNGAREAMKPQSIPAKIGFGGEQAAEFAIPGGAVSKGAKAAEGAIDAAKIAPVASKAFKLLTRGGLEAASAGGVTAAQGGSGKDIAENAAVGGALPAVGAVLKKGATALAEKAAPALANKLLRPVPTQLENAARFGRNPGQAIADEGIVATSHGDLVTRIGERKQDVGSQIGNMLKSTPQNTIKAAGLVDKGSIGGKVQMLEHPDFPGVTAAAKAEHLTDPGAARKIVAEKLRAFAEHPLPGQDPTKLRSTADAMEKSSVGMIDAGKIVNGHIDDAIKNVLSGKMEGGQALIDRLEEMRSQITQQRHLVEGKVQNLAPKNLNLSPADAHTLKRQIGDSAKWTGQAFDGEVNQVKRGIYRDLNGEVQKAMPGVKDLQDRYGNLLEAEKAAEREAARHEARNPFGLVDAVTGGAGAAIGAAHGGTPEAAFLALALPAARKMLQSPLAETIGVQGLKKAPKAVSPEFLKFVRNAAFGAQSGNRQQ